MSEPVEPRETYDDHAVSLFLVATVVWGIAAMVIGLWLALELRWPQLNFNIPWLTFSRLRPDHTFGVIFAFGGSALMASSYYIVQRTGQTKLAFPSLARFTFWGWQTVLVLAMVTMPLGLTQSKEYAEPEWFVDILLAVVWVSFGIVFFATLARRKIQHIYVSNWYFGALIIAVAMLHVVNNLALPVSLTKSYPVYSGTVDAMVQWWYGHNAVGFLLTAGFLGMMYYFVPRQADRPLWSYRLSIINFWALISIYMWAGSHHLMYTALPDWVQSLGTVFSLVLLIPSWGSAANGLLTFKGAWQRLSEDPIAKFMALALVFYAAVTLEGSSMALKTVNSLSHDTDWIIAHVHSGSLGWVAMITIGSLYAMAPRVFNQPQMYSTRAIDWHFRLHLSGTLIYVVSMWIAGVTEGLMWRSTDPNGALVYPFLDSLIAVRPLYVTRAFGGVLVVMGMTLMAWNLWRTVRSAHVPSSSRDTLALPHVLPYAPPAVRG